MEFWSRGYRYDSALFINPVWISRRQSTWWTTRLPRYRTRIVNIVCYTHWDCGLPRLKRETATSNVACMNGKFHRRTHSFTVDECWLLYTISIIAAIVIAIVAASHVFVSCLFPANILDDQLITAATAVIPCDTYFLCASRAWKRDSRFAAGKHKGVWVYCLPPALCNRSTCEAWGPSTSRDRFSQSIRNCFAMSTYNIATQSGSTSTFSVHVFAASSE